MIFLKKICSINIKNILILHILKKMKRKCKKVNVFRFQLFVYLFIYLRKNGYKESWVSFASKHFPFSYKTTKIQTKRRGNEDRWADFWTKEENVRKSTRENGLRESSSTEIRILLYLQKMRNPIRCIFTSKFPLFCPKIGFKCELESFTLLSGLLKTV